MSNVNIDFVGTFKHHLTGEPYEDILVDISSIQDAVLNPRTPLSEKVLDYTLWFIPKGYREDALFIFNVLAWAYNAWPTIKTWLTLL